MSFPIRGNLVPAIYENTKLHNTLLIVGGSLVALGIALVFIQHPVASALKGVTLSLGTPILLAGLMLTIVRKSQNNQHRGEQPNRPPNAFPRSRGHRLGYQ